jgi:hypothetical protein
MALLVHLDQFLDSYALSAAEALKRLARLQAIGLCPENNETTAGRIIDSLCRDGQTNVPVGLHERFQADVGRYEAKPLGNADHRIAWQEGDFRPVRARQSLGDTPVRSDPFRAIW